MTPTIFGHNSIDIVGVFILHIKYYILHSLQSNPGLIA